VSEYPNIAPDGKVESFIPLTAEELAFEKDKGGRVTLWSFGGIAEDGPTSGRGWCWFEKGKAVSASYQCQGPVPSLTRLLAYHSSMTVA
jgi:hypothetical protein